MTLGALRDDQMANSWYRLLPCKSSESLDRSIDPFRDFDVAQGSLHHSALPVVECDLCKETFFTLDYFDYELTLEWQEEVERYKEGGPISSHEFSNLLARMKLDHSDLPNSLFPGNLIGKGRWAVAATPSFDLYLPESPYSGYVVSENLRVWLIGQGVSSSSFFELVVYDFVQKRSLSPTGYSLLIPVHEFFGAETDCELCQGRIHARYHREMIDISNSKKPELIVVDGLGTIVNERFAKRLAELNAKEHIRLKKVADEDVSALDMREAYSTCPVLTSWH